MVHNGNCLDRKSAKQIFSSSEITKLFPATYLSSNEGINLIKKYNGIPILAHAYEGTDKTINSDNQVEKIIEKLVELGIEGIETHHYLHLDDNRINKLWLLADKFKLLKTVGSDCHSHSKKYNNITGLESRVKVLNSSKNYLFNDFISLTKILK
ncbi:MAG: hypothetical protein AB7V16_10635 [Vulcanibacillus sp.]